MALILKGGGLALALIIFMVVNSSPDAIMLADAQSPHNRARQLARDCNSGGQTDLPPRCGGGGGGGGGGSSGGGGSGSRSCRFRCCERFKWGDCKKCC